MSLKIKLNDRLNRLKPTLAIAGLIGLTLALCFIPLGYNLDKYCIQSWDESRNVVNALEMLQNHHWFVRYFENKPDMWELKPPFLVWCQAIAIHLFGLSELSVRLPSVIFSIATLVFLIWMSQKITRHVLSGCIASLILVSSQGYIGEHVARFGDHDVVLVFFLTVFIGLSYLYFNTLKAKYCVGLFVALFLGWFTKSIIIFMVFPGLVLWLLANKKLKKALLDKKIWTGMASVTAIVMLYYFVREKSSPDYIHQVWMNELFGRYSDTSSNYHYQKNEFLYYWHGFIAGRFWPFIILFLAGNNFIIANRSVAHRNFLLFLSGQCLLFFMILSAGTKNFWYDAPLYPMASLFIGILGVQVFGMIRKKFIKTIALVAFLWLLYPAYTKSLNYALAPDPNAQYPLQSMCYYLKNNAAHLPKKVKILTSDHLTPLYFYKAKAKEFKCDISFVNVYDLKINDKLLVSVANLKTEVDRKYTTRIIEQMDGTELRYILAFKK